MGDDDKVRWFLCLTKDGTVLDAWKEPAPAEDSWPPVERTDLPDPSITSFRGVEGERRPPWWRRWIAKVHDG